MNPDLTTLDAATRIWLSALGRAAWEGGIALGVAWALCRLLPRLPGTLQCWIWRLAYLRLLTSLLLPAPLALPLLHADTSLRDGSGLWAPGSGLVTQHAPRARTDSSRSGAPAATAAMATARGTRNPEPRAQSPEPPYHPEATSCLLILWLLGVGWRTHRLVADGRYTRRLRARARCVREAGLLADFRALAGRLRLRRAPLLLASEELCCPLLTGAARPAVLLPATAWDRFSRTELRLMVAHELTHLKRRDLLWAWLPNLSRVLFFFHPLVWLAEGEWRLTHEMACDEQAVAATAAAPTHYAAMLLAALAQLRKGGEESFLRAGVVESYGTIRRRLTALRRSHPMPPSRRVLSGAVIAAIGLVGALPWRLTARVERQSAPEPSVPRQALASSAPAITSDPLRITERAPTRHAPNRRPARERPRTAAATRSRQGRPAAVAPIAPAPMKSTVSRVATRTSPTRQSDPRPGAGSKPPLPTQARASDLGPAQREDSATLAGEPRSKPKYLMMAMAQRKGLSALDEIKLRAWKEQMARDDQKLRPAKKQEALDELKWMAWKKEQAASALLYLPKPIMLLSDKEEKPLGYFPSSEEYFKRLAHRKSHLGSIRERALTPEEKPSDPILDKAEGDIR